MSNYHKYGLLSTVRLTQLHETICQLKSIKYPTKQIKELIEHLEWIERDFYPTIRLLNEQQKSMFEKYNEKNLQLHLDFY